MIADFHPQRMSAQAYLDWEEQQPFKHEYLDGEAYAMTGGTLPHNDIALNLYRALYPHLRAKECRVNVSDAKVEVSANGPYFYPDIVVSCDERDRRALKAIKFPCLIIEVLSPSTEGFDRGEKFKQYRRLASLQDYVLVDSEKMSVDCYHRNENGKWELTAYPPDDESLDAQQTDVYFPGIDFTCSLPTIYEDVELVESTAQNNGIGVATD
jgi:Uma2 family endonuclease